MQIREHAEAHRLKPAVVMHPTGMTVTVGELAARANDLGAAEAAHIVDHADATDEFAEELLAGLRDRLAHYKCRRSISFEAQLPRTDTAKLYKQELVKKYS